MCRAWMYTYMPVYMYACMHVHIYISHVETSGYACMFADTVI